jgi:hypothetical protein
MYRLARAGVIRISDGLHITRGMREWGQYRAWFEAGGVPEIVAPDPVPLERRRAEICRRVERYRDRKLLEGVTANGARFDADLVSILRLVAVIAATAGGAPYPASFTLTTRAGVEVAMTRVQATALLVAFVARAEACHARARALLDALVASTDPEALDITAGWPNG